jgi:hypothetical protein
MDQNQRSVLTKNKILCAGSRTTVILVPASKGTVVTGNCSQKARHAHDELVHQLPKHTGQTARLNNQGANMDIWCLCCAIANTAHKEAARSKRIWAL